MELVYWDGGRNQRGGWHERGVTHTCFGASERPLPNSVTAEKQSSAHVRGLVMDIVQTQACNLAI